MCRVEFEREVFTLCNVRGFHQIGEAPTYFGVYLWCIEHRGEYLVHYVGKGDGRYGKGGIAGRLEREWAEFCKGWYWWPLKLEPFLGGCYLETDDAREKEVARQVEVLGPAFRIIVSKRIDGNCRKCENEIVYRLRTNDYTEQFLYKQQKRAKKRYPHTLDVDIPDFDEPRIIGLNVAVPSSLCEFVERWRR